MGYTAWPTEADFEALTDGITVPGYVDFDAELASAIAALERETGYSPFLAAGSDTDVKFTNFVPSGTYIHFPTGYVSVTELYIGDRLLVEGTEYHLSGGGGGPWEGATLHYAHRFPAYELRVVGEPGFGSDIPADVWAAVLGKTALNAFSLVASASAGGGPSASDISEVKQGPVTIKYGSSSTEGTTYLDGYKGAMADIAARWQSVISKYRRMTL